MIKLVVTDMDGTLLNTHRSISSRNLQMIHQLTENKIEFAIASGREYEGVRSILDQYQIDCEAILGNGAQYCDCQGNILMSCYLNQDVLSDIVNIYEKAHLPYMIYTTDGFYTMQDSQWVRDMFVERCVRRFGDQREDYDMDGPLAMLPCNNLQHFDDIQTFLNRQLEIIKIEIFSLNVADIAKTKSILKDIPTISYLSSFDDNIEVTDQNAQKGLILKKVIEQKGYAPDEVIVLGDGMNDITLFEQFPYSFAPANAVKEIRDLAYRVVSDCENDGFAEAIDIALKDLND